MGNEMKNKTILNYYHFNNTAHGLLIVNAPTSHWFEITDGSDQTICNIEGYVLPLCVTEITDKNFYEYLFTNMSNVSSIVTAIEVFLDRNVDIHNTYGLRIELNMEKVSEIKTNLWPVLITYPDNQGYHPTTYNTKSYEGYLHFDI